MSVNDDGLGPASDSFWEVDGYKSTVRRQEDGAKLCTDLMALIQERADIEKSYSKSLLAWNKKWMTSIDKGPEYGTTQAAWKAVLVESESIAQIHSDIRDQLLNEVQHKIKEWKAANFKKAMMGACKETKQLEDEFKKAQKPWAKKYHKVKEARKNYHHACKAEKSTTNLENNSRADSSLSPDQISLASFHTSTREIDDDGKRVRKMKKLADKAEKCRKEVESTEQKYQSALTDLNSYNPKYMEDMTMVFEKSDNNEEKRLVFFKEMLFGIHKCLDISQNPKIPQTYSQLHYTIDQADYQKDLKWWSQTRGKDMGMGWPQFEEFREELHDISRQRSREGVPDSGITLRRINTDKYKQEFAEYREGHHAISRKEKTRSTHIGGNEGITLTGLRTDNATNPPPPSYNNATMATSMTTDANGGSTGATPQASPNLQRLPSYDNEMNPFGIDDAANTVDLSTMEEAEEKSNKPAATPSRKPAENRSGPTETKHSADDDKKPKPEYDDSLNPFGDDDEDEEEFVDAKSRSQTPSRGATPPEKQGSSEKGATPPEKQGSPPKGVTPPERQCDPEREVTSPEKQGSPERGVTSSEEASQKGSPTTPDKATQRGTPERVTAVPEISVEGPPKSEKPGPPKKPPPPKPPRTPRQTKPQNQNPFGDDDFEEEEETLDTSNGTPVRAIYDYSGQEDDELTFKEGDVFLKLKDKDAQGWCTGMKDGTVGLYPDNYATPV